jgi:hypothetical protein
MSKKYDIVPRVECAFPKCEANFVEYDELVAHWVSKHRYDGQTVMRVSPDFRKQPVDCYKCRGNDDCKHVVFKTIEYLQEHLFDTHDKVLWVRDKDNLRSRFSSNKTRDNWRGKFKRNVTLKRHEQSEERHESTERNVSRKKQCIQK